MTSFIKCCLFNLIYCLFIFLLINGNEISETSKSLPFCGLAESSSRLVFVSTLNGQLTALNPNNDGSVVWSIHPGSEPMLSSSIHKLELSNYGHLVRMIPSLSGGLYKFNGENVEVIPVTVDHLLQSSFRYSDDLVMSGGKETQTFGVSLQSGRIIYECSMKSCGNVSHSTDGSEILIIQRLGQIVRAVEPRSGIEKWNFSVAQHDLKLLSECHSTFNDVVNYKLKVIVPEGVIYAVNLKNPSYVLWQHRFDSPIVSVWQLNKGQLVKVDLFNSFQTSPMDSNIPPSIYIGMHDKQLYVQESVTMQRKRHEMASKFRQKTIGDEKILPRIPWKPFPASMTALDVISLESESNSINDPGQRQTTALSVLYASPYVNGNGFFLYSEDALEEAKNASCNATIDENNPHENESDSDLYSIPGFTNDLSEADTPVEIVIVSFWYYWKEVLVISITTAVICNLMITRTFLRWKSKDLSASSERKYSKSNKDNDSGVDVGLQQEFENSESFLSQNYTSRYLTDFDPVACLGKGGFGVVFEAKNKIDDCHYAIKRILLPRKIESRDRVMREVKALAKLDHQHIVRYFNAWTECPPPGWQENYDKTWALTNSDIFSSDVTSIQTTTNNSEISRIPSAFLNIDSIMFPQNRIQSLKGGSNIPPSDISDSFIVFDDNSKNTETKEKDKIVNESVVIFHSDTENLNGKSIKSSLSKSGRPNSLLLNQKHSQESLNKIYLYIQMQLCQKESLRDWLMNNKKREYNNILSIFEQILQAVEHVHLHGLIHRDLKPSNIFFSLDNQIKIGDFGLVTAMTEGDSQMSPVECTPQHVPRERHTAQVGTQLYMSQEQLTGKAYNYKVDIYSLGLILFELLVPFSTQMERVRVLQDIKNDIFPESFQKTYKNEHELLRLMLSNSPNERPTTFGIRARLPLKQEPIEDSWHFELPTRRRTYSKTSQVSTSSSEGSADTR